MFADAVAVGIVSEGCLPCCQHLVGRVVLIMDGLPVFCFAQAVAGRVIGVGYLIFKIRSCSLFPVKIGEIKDVIWPCRGDRLAFLLNSPDRLVGVTARQNLKIYSFLEIFELDPVIFLLSGRTSLRRSNKSFNTIQE